MRMDVVDRNPTRAMIPSNAKPRTQTSPTKNVVVVEGAIKKSTGIPDVTMVLPEEGPATGGFKVFA